MPSFLRTLALAVACLSSLSLAAQPATPTLELRTTTGQTTFRIGERISLTLTLTGPDNNPYSISTPSYGPSGRLDIDTFDVSPATGWADPLAQYFSQGSFMGGGPSGSELLSAKPFSFAADLNEHIRFDEPGAYTVTATSHRVGATGKHLFPVEPHLALVSNPVEIHILPATAEWQAEKLRSILAIVAAPGKQTGMESEQRQAAIADLRFLNSAASIEALASHLREDSGEGNLYPMGTAGLGLSGVPDSLRDTALHALSRQLDDPAFPVGAWFLRIMAGLEASPRATSDDLRTSANARSKTVWQLALSGLARKQGGAFASTAETLLSNAPAGESEAIKAQIAAAVASTFAALPIDRQISELEDNWDELSRQPMLPVLEALLHQPPPAAGRDFYSVAERNVIVLKRWFALDPEGAVREVTAQLASPDARLSSHLIASLPGDPQPQLEAMWARELVESEEDERQTLLAAVLVRFGTGSATAQVERKLNSLAGKWACEPQAAALAYVVKFDFANAAGLVRRALASTQDTYCYETLFSSVSAYAHGPALNEAAIAGLHNANPRAAADAARYLRCFGGESAKQPLLERYREWSTQWAAKPGEVDPATESGYPVSDLGYNLGQALIPNQAWLADPKLTAEVLSRCVGEQMCSNLRQLASQASSPKPNVTLNRSAIYENYQIGPYGSTSMELFEAKLAQYPKGTKFALIPTSPRNGDQLALEREAEALFAKYGMTLEITAVPITAEASVP